MCYIWYFKTKLLKSSIFFHYLRISFEFEKKNILFLNCVISKLSLKHCREKFSYNINLKQLNLHLYTANEQKFNILQPREMSEQNRQHFLFLALRQSTLIYKSVTSWIPLLRYNEPDRSKNMNWVFCLFPDGIATVRKPCSRETVTSQSEESMFTRLCSEVFSEKILLDLVFY